jgi:hypothetical protein
MKCDCPNCGWGGRLPVKKWRPVMRCWRCRTGTLTITLHPFEKKLLEDKQRNLKRKMSRVGAGNPYVNTKW